MTVDKNILIDLLNMNENKNGEVLDVHSITIHTKSDGTIYIYCYVLRESFSSNEVILFEYYNKYILLLRRKKINKIKNGIHV